jgi:PhzF family phenazine biosynthesis protein
MQRRYITVDVFTDRAFGGNPLAVVLDAGGLSTAQMQAIAIEFNYSETTFVLPAAGPDARCAGSDFYPLARPGMKIATPAARPDFRP